MKGWEIKLHKLIKFESAKKRIVVSMKTKKNASERPDKDEC